jgi:hypothetical protein
MCEVPAVEVHVRLQAVLEFTVEVSGDLDSGGKYDEVFEHHDD